MNTLSLFVKIACSVSLVAAVACTGNTSNDPKKTASVARAASTDPEDEGAGDKVTCKVDSDCDSDERCVDAKCAGLDGDRD